MADDSVSSSDSDDDFLTSNATGVADREAIVRKKLLENFYGKTAVEVNDDANIPSIPTKRSASMKSDDLDSPHYDAEAHVKNLIENSSIHDLLEVEEKLALEVRNLDSTMQTLVYENYSRFIDATDAIRSIGVNVQNNEGGLSMLTKAMENVNDRSRIVDTALGQLRDQVAEKIRIQRLLTRLDALLKLPMTLEEQIGAGKYKTATSSYLNARAILAKHSQGFESLKSIETECNAILEKLKAELKTKLFFWSGRLTESYDNEAEAPNPPSSMSEVFEVSGTIYLLVQQEADEDINREDIYGMCISAAMRLLDRLLDSHLLEVQERRFAATLDKETKPTDGSLLIPQNFLNDLLECVVMYGKSFEPEDNFYLVDFVAEAYNSFLSHVRSILLEESIQANKDDGEEVNDNKEISGALSLLVQYVQELASGLAGCGVSEDFVSKMVDQAVDLSDSIVRRRVEQKFQDLRTSVVKECLVAFSERVIKERELALKDDKPVLPEILQIASSTLSDCLQLVDDASRSIFAEDGTDDPTELKDAVQHSTQNFVLWLANAFEVLAGGESTDARHLVEAPLEYDGADSDDDIKDEGFDAEGPIDNSFSLELANDDKDLLDLIDSAKEKIMGDSSMRCDFVLAILELCRISEGSVSVNLQQSFNAHMRGAKRKSRGLFPTGEPSDLSTNVGSNEIAARFKLAASHVMMLYATDRGSEAAGVICEDLVDVSAKPHDDTAERPRDAVLEMLRVVKRTAIASAGVFGGAKRGGPIPEWKDEGISGLTTSGLGRKTGLSLDVERMFKEQVTIYPHPSKVLEVSTSAVLFLVLKIAFRALFEHARLLSFSSAGFHQMLLDTIFLKRILPHYVNEDYAEEGTNACSALQTLLDDVIEVVDQRCSDDQSDRLRQNAKSSVHAYMDLLREDSSVGKHFIIAEDAGPDAETS